jgi:Coenzyme PQQ synthesis protein D (PqqD)
MTEELRLRNQALEWREIEDEIVAVDTRKAIYMAINHTGAVLWPALAEGATRAELVERLTRAYEIDRGAAEGDVDAFVTMLEEQDLLER